MAAAALAPVVPLLPLLLALHRRIDLTEAPDAPPLQLGLFWMWVAGLLPLALTAPWLWQVTNRLQPLTRDLTRWVLVVLIANLVLATNNVALAATAGYLILLAFLALTLIAGVTALITRTLPVRLAVPLVAMAPIGFFLGFMLDVLALRSTVDAAGGLSGLGISLSAGATLPWGAAAVFEVRFRHGHRRLGPEEKRRGFVDQLPSRVRRLTADHALSLVAIAVAGISVWFSYQANRIQQDVRVRGQADQVILLVDVPRSETEHLVIRVQNYSRLPVRQLGVYHASVRNEIGEMEGVDVGTLGSCEEARISEQQVIAMMAFGDDANLLIDFEDVAGVRWQRRLAGAPTLSGYMPGFPIPSTGVEVATMPRCSPS